MRSMYLMKDDFAGYENLGLSTGTKFIDTDYFHFEFGLFFHF